MSKFLALIVFVTSLTAHAGGLCDWPDPGYKIHEGVASIVDKTEYNKILDQVEKAYAPVFQKLGYTLKIHRSWSDGTVNAQAWWTAKTCNVEMFGGLARWKSITSAGYRQVALHEIGHCLGGPPYFTGENMSVEGQADYYSTSVGCNAVLKVGCKNSSLNLARVLAELGGESKPWRPGPVLPNVTETYQDHPEAQCRLDTFDAGLNKQPRPGCWFYK